MLLLKVQERDDRMQTADVHFRHHTVFSYDTEHVLMHFCSLTSGLSPAYPSQLQFESSHRQDTDARKENKASFALTMPIRYFPKDPS